MRARLALLLLFAEVVITRSQTTADVDFMKSSPLGCFSRGYEFDFYIPNTNINTTQLKLCQEHCQYVPGCVRFVYKAFWGECRGTADENAVEIPSESPYLIAGYRSCEPESMQPPPRCRTETPGNGFPGTSPQSSQLAWPGGKQPYSLECWPKRWDGAPLACTEVGVLDSTKNGWPGKCRGLVEMHGINGTACGQNCRENPSCQSWQNTVYYSCWQGLGKDCFVRGNFVPREAERLQHGSVRVLKDLTGYQIIGLWKGFDNSEGFFQKNEDAIAFCKHMCYSDIRCQYWTYAPNFGCWLEDASQEYGPPYPLTLEAARRDTDFAKDGDCVAGEYIQHFCPATGLPSQGEDVADGATECAERGYRYEPPSMFLSHRTVEPNWEACRSRCKWTVYCNYFAFWPDGGCLITGTDSQRVMAESYEVISGPIHCNASYRTAAPSVEAWASQTTLPNIGHSEVASVTAAPETMAHMAEIEIPIFGLDVGQLAANDQHLLEGRYAEAIAKTLALPVSEIKEGPDQNDLDAQVHLSPGVGGGCILTAWTPNEPVSSSDPSVLRSKLKTPALITNLKLATTQAQLPVSALPGAQIQVGEPQVGTKEHPLQALVEPPSFWSQWWPLLIALTFVPGFFRAAPADRDRGCGVPGEVSF
ncbi:unnamed protein product [Durusdinium trenchii]|uniref:Apple domain-containing protein n=1 Tax=Durusdinium trenchii TaxID=1381693 RepID=A0ABP0R4F2_9DINO